MTRQLQWKNYIEHYPPERAYRTVETWELEGSKPVDSKSSHNFTVSIQDDRIVDVFFHQDRFLRVRKGERKLRYHSSTEPNNWNTVVAGDRPPFDPWIVYSREISQLPLRIMKKMVASWSPIDRIEAEDAYFGRLERESLERPEHRTWAQIGGPL